MREYSGSDVHKGIEAYFEFNVLNGIFGMNETGKLILVLELFHL